MISSILCSNTESYYLLFSEKVPPLVYYSHLPTALISLLFGIYVYKKNKKGLENCIILFITSIFFVWVMLDSVFWASNRSDIVMFVWSTQILIEPLIHLGLLYLVLIILRGKDINFKMKLLLLLLYAPVVIGTLMGYTLLSFDLEKCLSNESIFSYYTYILEAVYTIWLVLTSVIYFLKTKDNVNKIKIIYISSCVTLLMTSFSFGAILGSFTDNWELAQFSLFVMPIFVYLLIYITIRFNLFKLNLVDKNILILSPIVLVASLLVINDINLNRILVLITLFFIVTISYMLIKLIKRDDELTYNLSSLNSSLSDKVALQTKEITHSYELEKKARRELEKIVEAKDRFISITQHNLRIPITNITKRIDSLISETANITNEKRYSTLMDLQAYSTHLNCIADEFKNISKLKPGSQILNLSNESLLPIVETVLCELKIDIENKKISITFYTDNGVWPKLKIDKNKIREVFLVILENAVLYNVVNGTISINTESDGTTFKINIANTGIGINNDEKSNIENGSFFRGNIARELNPIGMGIGLSISKSIIEAHHGTIEIKSDGTNTGASVKIQIPIDFMASFSHINF